MHYRFKTSWGYKVQNYRLTPVSVRNISQTMEYINNLNGDAIRILLTNKYGSKPLLIRSLKISINNKPYTLTVNDSERIKIPPFSEIYTDELNVDIQSNDTVKIETSFGFKAKATSIMSYYSDDLLSLKHHNFLNKEVNLGQRTRLLRNPDIFLVAAIARVEVYTLTAKNITVFGDSLTHHSYWTAALQNRLNKEYPDFAIINAGQGGNRLIHDANTVRIVNDKFGISGLNRVRNDVFQYGVPDLVIVAIGVNDLIHPGSGAAPRQEEVSFDDLKDAYIRLHNILSDYNTKTVITTITPFYNYNESYTKEREQIRQQINDWIRNQSIYDYVIDTDKIIRDTEEARRLSPQYDGGDHLHFAKAGGHEIANQIDLKHLLSLIE